MMHESTLSSHTTLHDLWPYLHRCNMTLLPPSILASGGDSMNFYYAVCVCCSVWLFLLIFSTISETWKCISHCQKIRCFLLPIFEFSVLKSERICIANLHILRVCFCVGFIFLSLNHNFQLECDGQFSSHAAWQTGAWMDMRCSVLQKFGPEELALSLQNKIYKTFFFPAVALFSILLCLLLFWRFPKMRVDALQN